MKKIIVLIEKGKGDFYSAYIPNNPLPYGIIGDGYSVEEAKADFEQSYAEMKAFYAEQNMPFKEAEFSFQYDMPSFLRYYGQFITLSGMQQITGISRQQLSQYLNGTRNASARTTMKITQSMKNFGKKLESIVLL